MSEEQKTPPVNNTDANTQEKDQLQALVKETLKENKILLNKNSKLETKYVELFKEHRLLKKDHTVFVSFFQKFLNNQINQEPSKSTFQEQVIGQYELAELEKLIEQKLNLLRQRINELQGTLQSKIRDVRSQLQKLSRDEKERIISDYESKIKISRDEKERINSDYESKLKINREDQSKQMHSLLRDIQSLKKVNKRQSEQILQLKQVIETKGQQLSKLSKEKLKLEHHLNNIRKNEIKQELSPEKEKQEQKMHIQRNQFLSLRQQVESLLAKRDQLKRDLKESNAKLEQEQQLTKDLSQQVSRLNKIQSQLNEKYELVRQCTVEELENMILNNHIIPENKYLPEKQVSVPSFNQKDDKEEIQRQYLKNVIVRYIKAEANGDSDQSLTLLQIIGTLLKLDNESVRALDQYKLKRRQWWNLNY